MWLMPLLSPNSLKCLHIPAGAVCPLWGGMHCQCVKGHGNPIYIKLLGRFAYGRMKGGFAVTMFGGEERAC